MDTTWDHNAWYHRRLLAELPRRTTDVLEVGCGAGTLATRLAARSTHVDALDRAPHMVEHARLVVPANVTVRVADVLTVDLPAAHYDAVVSMSVLHHLDLAVVLPRLAAALRPGGLLVAAALPAVDLPRELPLEATAALAHRALGLISALEGVLTGRRRFAHEPGVAEMPMQDPVLTTAEVREQAAAVLPGVRVQRLVFWRYLLRWRRPG